MPMSYNKKHNNTDSKSSFQSSGLGTPSRFSWISVYKISLYAFLIFLAAMVAYKGYNLLFPDPVPTPVFLNPNLETQREREVQRDTVIKWYEKIIYKQSDPEIIYVQKIKRDTIHRTDSILITRYRSFDLITKLDKSGNNLIIKTYNEIGRASCRERV